MAAPLSTDPQDVALDTDGDILIDPLKGLVFVTGIPAVVQLVTFQLKLFWKEWFLNQDKGIHFFEELIGDASKVPGVENRARVAFGAAILSVPAVETILQLDVKVDSFARKMKVTWQAHCAFGNTPEVSLEVP